jgi:alpha-beta hydrolase superfamily lysophospholipase
MDVTVNKMSFSYLSADQQTTINALKWVPEGKIKAIVQIAHGMSEHIERYDAFANYLAQNGYIVCANDHLGHGKSITSSDKLGYFSDKNGWENMVEDMHNLTKMMKQEYEGYPYILMGHSMGSLLSRAYAAIYGDELGGAIYTGTSAGSIFINFLITRCKKYINEKGAFARGEDINNSVSKKYNKKAYPRTSQYDWLSRDIVEIEKYLSDPLCGFVFTYKGFLDLFELTKEVTGRQWASKVPCDLPIYFFSGNMDPVGAYSHGVVKVADWLVSTGHRNVISKFYDGGRHEMLHELNRKMVYKDTLRWLDKLLKAPEEGEEE